MDIDAIESADLFSWENTEKNSTFERMTCQKASFFQSFPELDHRHKNNHLFFQFILACKFATFKIVVIPCFITSLVR